MNDYPDVVKKMISDGYIYIYKNKYMYVLTRKGQPYTLVNANFTFKDFDDHRGHCHGINNKDIAIKMCDYIVARRMPFGVNRYITNGFIRCSEGKYHNDVVNYVERKNQRCKPMYYNVNKGVVHR